MADDLFPELEYLSPDFDPNTLTMPRLRNILLEYNVDFPSSAKKPQLVELFNDNIVPQAKKILRSRNRTKRSTRGISDVNPQQSVEAGDYGDENSAIPSVEETPRRSSRRTASRASSVQSTGNVLTPRASQSARSSVAARSRASASTDISDSDAGRRVPSNRVRKSMGTPIAEEVEYEEEDTPMPDVKEEEDESFFSTDNPFQSGSSPTVGHDGADGVKTPSRRKTTGLTSDGKKTTAESARRKTDQQIVRTSKSRSSRASQTQPTRSRQSLKTGEINVPAADEQEESEESEEVEAGEEFTPEEQQELIDEEIETETALMSPRNKSLTKPGSRRGGSSFLGTAPWAVLMAILGGLFTLWRQEKINVGYCGVGQPSAVIAGVEIPEWADQFRPQCEPCPPHAACFQNLITSCEKGFILTQHPLSLNGLLPIPPTCQPDGEKARRVKAVTDRAVEELRDRNAAYECGELKGDQGKRINTPAVQESVISAAVSSKRRKGMSQAEFDDLWVSALDELSTRDEIISDYDTRTNRRTLRSTSKARIGLACSLRLSLRETLAANLGKLFGIVGILGSLLYGRHALLTSRDTESKAKQLASYALDRLAEQASLCAYYSDKFPESYISMTQLRDDVLRDEFSASRRAKLWTRVQKKVEGNANVRSMVREGRTGEVSRVWEWVGAVSAPQALEASSPEAYYRSSRQSGGVDTLAIDNSPSAHKPEMGERRKWTEARPTF